MKLASTMLTALAVSLISGAAFAAELPFSATLNGATEVPPKSPAGTGELLATLDTATKTLTYTLTYQGLTGPATAAHFHGPAAAGANAGVVVPIAPPLDNPVHGSAKLTDAQIKDLEAGKWYANVHTAANPGGEIRGQVLKAKN
jgi:hypothetical protein